ncbi:BCCT family transporter [Falsirhodobacter halotolerans]|uniref:BCCT family transporter n=1 Tax=Falsirhodobacter halotolerans TaxID=1146892 RepID=UPI001FD584DF|nr:BCCT family transporter [Falsirhodobacter halotolerans]MCJ8138768.1 BCCT family transporter [Falsirhodobacter halotolerans]
MTLKPPLTELDIKTADTGFYDGFSRTVAVTAKILIGALILWAIVFPQNAGNVLNAINAGILTIFSRWYIYVTSIFLLLCVALALIPAAGRMKLGTEEDRPEFGTFSWFSMMFGAGIGVGMLTYATGEPISHFSNSPEIITGQVAAASAGSVRPAFEWSFLHWGLTAWAGYAITGMALAYLSYRRGLPLTIRSALTPLFGTRLSGWLGHVVDIVAVVATVVGVAQTLGFGVEQFVSGLYRVTGAGWLLNVEGSASATAIILGLLIIVGASTLSAVSGVGRGIKWLSNLNIGLSFLLLAVFLIFGSTLAGLQALGFGIVDYLWSLPMRMFAVWQPDSTPTGDALSAWQGAWSVFYWAWWIAVAPFVGLFLARISRGRTIREFVFGAMVMPSLMCFIWFALVGGTAIDLELSGLAQGTIINSVLSDQLFAALAVMFPPAMAVILSAITLVLLLTYLVTTADSAILIVNTINAAGDDGPKTRLHVLFWGIALIVMVGALLIAGGISAIQSAMVVGALPFSIVMVLMGVALVKAIIKDNMREQANIPTTVEPAE